MLGGWLTKAKGRPWIQTELPAQNKLFDKICQTQIFKNPGTHVSCKDFNCHACYLNRPKEKGLTDCIKHDSDSKQVKHVHGIILHVYTYIYIPQKYNHHVVLVGFRTTIILVGFFIIIQKGTSIFNMVSDFQGKCIISYVYTHFCAIQHGSGISTNSVQMVFRSKN